MVPELALSNTVQTKLNATSPDATAASKGLVQLAGDLGGTAAAPTVPNAVMKSELVLNVKDFGAIGDGVTNDTVAMQAAIDACAAANGGIILLPNGTYLVSTLTLKANVTLSSLQGQFSYTNSPCNIKSNGSGPVIDTPVSAITTCAIIGIRIDGSSTASVGIRFRSVSYGRVAQCIIVNCLDQGILHSAGAACTFEDILMFNCLLTRIRGGPAGVLELRGTDDFAHRVEANCSLTSGKSDSNFYCYAVYVQHDANFLSHVVGEISDGGFLITGHYNQFVACRADLNWSVGWKLDGPGGTLGKNMFSACHALNNGRDSANTHSGFLITTSAGNVFSACRNTQNGSGSGSSKYAFEDQTAYSAIAYTNTFVGCDGDYSTALFYTDAFTGSAPSIPNHPVRHPDGATTPDVTNSNLAFLATYTAPATVTNFIGGVVGQVLTVLGNSNVTIAHNATIKTSSGANKVLSSNVVYRFTNYNGVWYEDALPSVGSIAPNIQIFTSSGTWTKPAGATVTTAYVIAGGAGGGSGRRGAAGTARFGGGGGAAGAFYVGSFSTALLGATETVTVGTGGAGGAAVSTDDTNGNTGVSGGLSKFGVWLSAIATAGGGGGTVAAGSGGQASGAGAGGGSSITGAGGGGNSNGPNPSSGAAGGGISAADVAFAGGTAFMSFTANPYVPISGGAVDTAGTNGPDRVANTASSGAAGSGGGAYSSVAAGAGGNAGLYGAGGGGGGASLNGHPSGAGGNGANGIVVVISQ